MKRKREWTRFRTKWLQKGTGFAAAGALAAAMGGGCEKDRPRSAEAVKAPAPVVATGRALVAPAGAGGIPAALHEVVPAEEPDVYLRKEIETAAKVDPAAAERMATMAPRLKCVDKTPGADGRLRAHFGFANKSQERATIPVGFYNRVWPPPIGQGQPTAFDAGAQDDVLQVPFEKAGSVAWVLGASFQLASATSPVCGAARSVATHGASKRPARR